MLKEEASGIVFNIQHYSVHDGPGIRTVVFLKGCPLRCRWCANPESQNLRPELGWTEKDCIGCESCVRLLPELGCQLDRESGLHWEADTLPCADRVKRVCPGQALHVIGERMTVSQVLEQVEKDEIFYDNSGGGITLSGGEPLMQADFAEALLREAGKHHLNRAMESSGFATWSALERVAAQLDFLFFDIKVLDEKRHLENTGVSNQLILENLRKARAAFPKLGIRVRTPVIPGVNDSEEEIGAIAAFLRTVPNVEYELLKYHRFGQGKYKTLRREYPMGDVELSEEQFQTLKKTAVL